VGVGQIWHWLAPAGIKSYINRCNYQTYLLHVRHLLALAGTCRQAFSWYRSHGIALLTTHVATQYHAMRVEPFMVFVVEH
jgi:hypothetical protein